MQCNWYDSAPERGIRGPSWDPSPGNNLWDTEPIPALRGRTVVLQNLLIPADLSKMDRKVAEGEISNV